MLCPCMHPIFEYLGCDYWGNYDANGDAIKEQMHRCIDCGHMERDVPDGSVMLGHLPGECSACDAAATYLPEADRQRWIDLTERGRDAR